MKKLLSLFALIPTLLFGQTPTIQQVTNSGNTSTKIIKYNANHGIQFDAKTLVDKEYVDSAGTAKWSLTGNNVGSSAKFLGTIDNFPLKFRVNNSVAGEIQSDGATANTFLGFSNGLSNTTGKYNTSFGWGSFWFNTSGDNNTAIGLNTLTQNTTGSGNIAIGSGALIFNTTGNLNVAVGKDALSNSVTGSNNVAIGVASLQQNNSGTNNCAIGSASLSQNNSGSNNSAVGFNSLQFNTTGSDNAADGYLTLGANTTGSANVALGTFALDNNTTGSNNVAVGWKSGFGSMVANKNTTFGSESFMNNVSGNENVAIGYNVMPTNVTGGHNTVIGSNADVSADGFTNATAIGYNSVVGASNSLVLGDGSAKVGINTSTPSEMLHVVGSIRMVDGNEAANKVLTSDVNGVGSWQTASAGWALGGNTVGSAQSLGTLDNYDLPFIGNNTEWMRLSKTGTLILGATSGGDKFSVNVPNAAGDQIYQFINQTGNNYQRAGFLDNTGGFGYINTGFTYHKNYADGSNIFLGNTNTAAPTISVSGSDDLKTSLAFGAGGKTNGLSTQINNIGQVQINTSQTSVNNSVSGTTIFSQPQSGGTYKEIIIAFTSALGTASYTYPIAFSLTPSIVATNNVAAGIITSLSNTAVTVTGATTSGFILLIGY